MEEKQSADPEELAAINQQFHRAIWQASHNQTLVDLLDRLHLHLYRYPSTTYSTAGRAASSLAEHRELVDAIVSREADRAAAAAMHHMTWNEDPTPFVWHKTAEEIGW